MSKKMMFIVLWDDLQRIGPQAVVYRDKSSANAAVKALSQAEGVLGPARVREFPLWQLDAFGKPVVPWFKRRGLDRPVIAMPSM